MAINNNPAAAAGAPVPPQTSLAPSTAAAQPPALPAGWVRNTDGFSASRTEGGFTYTINPGLGGNLAELCQKINAKFETMKSLAEEVGKERGFQSLKVSLPKDSDPIAKAIIAGKEQNIESTAKYKNVGELRQALADIFSHHAWPPPRPEGPIPDKAWYAPPPPLPTSPQASHPPLQRRNTLQPQPPQHETSNIDRKHTVANAPQATQRYNTAFSKLQHTFYGITDITNTIFGQITQKEWETAKQACVLKVYTALVKEHNEDDEITQRDKFKIPTSYSEIPAGARENLETVIPRHVSTDADTTETARSTTRTADNSSPPAQPAPAKPPPQAAGVFIPPLGQYGPRAEPFSAVPSVPRSPTPQTTSQAAAATSVTKKSPETPLGRLENYFSTTKQKIVNTIAAQKISRSAWDNKELQLNNDLAVLTVYNHLTKGSGLRQQGSVEDIPDGIRQSLIKVINDNITLR